jgi:predicted nuclease with TOPRIM domain
MPLLLSSKSFSQTDTRSDDTARVRLKVPTAFKAFTDIIHYDDLKESTVLMQKQLANLQKEVSKKDSMLTERDGSINNLKLINSDYEALRQNDQLKYKDLEKKYKGQVRLGRFELVLLGGSIAFGIYQTFKK